ncbi:3D domain-containing protein [Sporosarcina thermotolerans]|uniref:3D domain-containing protein n=1 Tax=Sporosarcina thermotolerans TaxID=633404 RepID=UPI0024BC681F|nr:3D domain-containing protein [Sporosarcina thermotolerans]WHT49877.1 3D domain-containing protein [Sporosarcina thermotolerans]
MPLGTKVWVEGYGEAIAGDTGGAIKGHRIDVFIPSYDSAMEWGVKKVKIIVLN